MGIVIFDGVAYGMLLFLIAVGLSITMGLMNFVNLAHGAFAMVGGYAAAVLMNSHGWNFFAALAASFVAAAVAGGVLELLLYRRLYRAHPLDQVLLSIGIVFVAIAGFTYFFGPSMQPFTVPEALAGQIHVAGIEMGRYRLFLIACGVLVLLALLLLLNRTRFGAMVRASVDNQRVARGMGIDVGRVFSLTFALGSALAGLGGALGVEMLGLDPEFPVKYLVYFLIVVSVGGSGNILGSLYAAILLGVADVVGKYYIPQIGAFIIYAVMVATLILRPHGLFGRPHK